MRCSTHPYAHKGIFQNGLYRNGILYGMSHGCFRREVICVRVGRVFGLMGLMVSLTGIVFGMPFDGSYQQGAGAVVNTTMALLMFGYVAVRFMQEATCMNPGMDF